MAPKEIQSNKTMTVVLDAKFSYRANPGFV
jgi:hypothetical protein